MIGKIIKRKYLILAVIFLAVSVLIWRFVNREEKDLYVVAYPADVKIMVDGEKFENGSALKNGKHRISVMRSGFKSYDEELRLDDSNRALYVELEPEDGKIRFAKKADFDNYEIMHPDSEIVKRTHELLLIGDVLPYLESLCGDETCSSENLKELEIDFQLNSSQCSQFYCVRLNNMANRAWASEVLTEFGYNLDDYEVVSK